MGHGIYWVHDEEQHMRIKNRRKLIEYQVRFFRRELKKEQTMLEKLDAKQEMRKNVFHCRFDSREELDDEYRAGKMTDKDYIEQRSALWKTYSDRGHTMRIEWLESELAKYEKRLAMVNEARHLSAEEWEKEREKKARHNHLTKMRMRRYRQRLKEKERLEALKKQGEAETEAKEKGEKDKDDE